MNRKNNKNNKKIKKSSSSRGGVLSHFVRDREGVVGIDMTTTGVRLVELEPKGRKWVVKSSGHGFNKTTTSPMDLNEVAEDHVNTIKRLYAENRIKNTQVAVAIPVTGSVIRTINMPLMSDQELKEAVETESLWDNLVEVADEFGKYSVFWHVVRRNQDQNTMDLLFIAAKLEEINTYVGIVRAAGLNPVVVDSRCMAIRDALAMRQDVNFDDQVVAVVEVGSMENYVAIYQNGIPEITDLYVSDHDKRRLAVSNLSEDEVGGIMQRFSMQIRQCLSGFEDTHPEKLDRVFLVSALTEFTSAANFLKEGLEGYRVELPDPFAGVKNGKARHASGSLKNLSGYAAVVGLATRKLDIFGYYLSSSALSAINLLPERERVRKTEKIKYFSQLGIGLLSLLLLVGSGWSYYVTNQKERALRSSLVEYERLKQDSAMLLGELKGITQQKRALKVKLDVSKDIYSNKAEMFELLDQINHSVPQGVWLTTITYGDVNSDSVSAGDELTIEGKSVNDENIVIFIGNLASKGHISQASLLSMTLPDTPAVASSGKRQVIAKSFKLRCKLSGVQEALLPSDDKNKIAGGGE